MSLSTNSAPKVLKLTGNRLALYEFLIRIRFRRKTTLEPIDVSGWDLQLKATSKSGMPSFSATLATTIVGDDSDILQCISETPRTAGLTEGTDVTLRDFYLSLTRAGTAGRKLIARITMSINPDPDPTEFDSGPLDPEDYVIEYDDETGEYQSTLADPLAVYDSLFSLVAGRLPVGSATTASAMAAQALPTQGTLYKISTPIDIDGETYPPGYYFRNTDGSLDRFETTSVATPS